MPLRRSNSARSYDRQLPGLVALLDDLYAEYEKRESQYEPSESQGEREVLRQLAHVFSEAKHGEIKEEGPRRRERDISPQPPPGARLVMVEEIRRRPRTKSHSEADEPREEPREQKRVVKSNEIEGVRVKYSFPAHLYKRLQSLATQDEKEGVSVTFNIPAQHYEADPARYSPERLLRQAQHMVYGQQAPPQQAHLYPPVTMLPPSTPPMVVYSAPRPPAPQAHTLDEQEVVQDIYGPQEPVETSAPAPQQFDVQWGPRRHTEGRTNPKVQPVNK